MSEMRAVGEIQEMLAVVDWQAAAISQGNVAEAIRTWRGWPALLRLSRAQDVGGELPHPAAVFRLRLGMLLKQAAALLSQTLDESRIDSGPMWEAFSVASGLIASEEWRAPTDDESAILRRGDAVVFRLEAKHNQAPEATRRRGRVVSPETVAERQLVAERWKAFCGECSAHGRRATWERFAEWAVEQFEDMPTDCPDELKRMRKAHCEFIRSKK